MTRGKFTINKSFATVWQEWQEADRQDMVTVLHGIRGTAASILQDMGANIDREEEPETSAGRNLA